MTSRNFFFYWFPILLYICCIFIASSFSRLPFSIPVKYIDKIVHFLEYTILGLLAMRALLSTGKFNKWYSTWLICVVAVIALGGIDELYQSLVPNRASDLYDFVADAAGAVVGCSAYYLIVTLQRRKTQTSST